MIVDRIGRQFKNLRVSLTSACNYACSYCVPAGEKRLSAKHELTADQLLRAVDLLHEALGLEKIRITGGEPLMSEKFDAFLLGLPTHSFEDVSITTNGQLLEKKIPLLLENGIKRINVSLDTLDSSAFREISKGGDLFSVLTGIEFALNAGIKIKINTVPLKSKNINQVIPLLEYCFERGIELRFIELMRMGHLKNNALFARDYYGMEELLQQISEHYSFVRTDAPFDSTAVRFQVPNKGSFGIIANESEPFCSSCTRLRLSSSGHLHGCLSSDSRHYIGDLLELPVANRDQAVQEIKQRLTLALTDKQMVFSGGETVMRIIGG